MEERVGDVSFHLKIAIRDAGRAAFEEVEDTAHLGVIIESGDNMHLGGARIGKDRVETVLEEGFHQGMCAVHVEIPCAATGNGRVRGHCYEFRGTNKEPTSGPRAARGTLRDRF